MPTNRIIETITKCPCCGWSLETQRKADEVQQWWSQMHKEQREREKDMPRGDCPSCVENDEPCSYSCVGF